ncbi:MULTISPECIES: phage tail tube assembly chaperone [Lactobacillus]|uniref:Phage tail protein n=1 Tax=Lactobacillus xujianguonis TaxID=2495899 RepID=A0A437SY37_9LACO|nr:MULTISPECIES: phage tail tube assembly chaperone [Lactobacillus]RVU71780.1 hypothetical protein EJK17_00440 [Lactobacillus xujianguonis]
MSVKINGKKLHLTTFEVPTSGKNIIRCLTAQRDFAKENEIVKNMDSDNDDSVIKGLEAQIKMIDLYVKFLKPILHLSDAQEQKVEESDFDDVVDLANEVIAKVLGYNSDKSDESDK